MNALPKRLSGNIDKASEVTIQRTNSLIAFDGITSGL